MVDNALAAIGIGVGRDSLVVISGSNPPGVPEDFTIRLTLRLAGTGARVVADTSGPALRHLVNNPCKINVLRMEDSALFAGTLVRKGVAETAIIARGADGSTLASKGKAIHCARPITEIVSAVGAGDSFVGAFTLALARGMDLAESLRHGTAAASAAVLTEATQLCTPEDAERLLPGCELTEI